MPLTRGRLLGYNASRMIFQFTMMHGARMIDCGVSSVALDDLAGERGTRPNEREAQFRRLRDTIERIASDIFDEPAAEPLSNIRIFSKHVRNR